MSTKPPECWTIDPNARAVRVERSPDESLYLPLDQFALAEYRTGESEQQLRLVFATHEVTIRGQALHRIAAAIQRLDLASVSVLPPHQRAVAPDGQAVISSIAVIETAGSSTDEASPASPSSSTKGGRSSVPRPLP